MTARKPPPYEPSGEDVALAGQWPVRVDVQYNENGPEVLCDARVEHTSPGGRTWAADCGTAITGFTLDELRGKLAEHLHYVEHVAEQQVSGECGKKVAQVVLRYTTEQLYCHQDKGHEGICVGTSTWIE